MELLINISMAWVTVLLMVLLLVIYVLRKWIAGSKLPKDHFARKLNRALRKSHIHLGSLAVITGLIHGIYSSIDVLSGNKGTLLWVLFILLGASYGLRKFYSKKGAWIKIHRVLAALTLIFLVLHILEVGGFVGIEPIKEAIEHLDGHEHDENEEGKGLRQGPRDGTGKGASQQLGGDGESHESYDLTQIEDGVYAGEAEGYRPGLQVAVSVANGMITDVVVTDHNEHKEQFWGEPVEKIPLAIVDSQSTEVDIISGATYTSYGIMHAVEDALTKAMLAQTEGAAVETSEAASEETSVKSAVTETASTTAAPTTAVSTTNSTTTTSATTTTTSATSTQTTTEATVVEEPTSVADSLWYDGTYIGEATGFNDGLFVEVIVENGLVTRVRVTRHSEEGYSYYARPVKEIPAAIVSLQSTQVDVISGATYTSRGIMKAVDDALEDALK